MPSRYVKPYVKRNKNDMADAEAIREAVRRPIMRFVEINTRDQQSVLMLFSRLKEITGCPVVVSAGFKVRGKRTACMLEDAFRFFMETEIEVLAAGNCYLRKEDQDPSLNCDYKNTLELD